MPLTQWLLAFYFVCQDKRGASAVRLAMSYKTAWFMLRRIRAAMGQRNELHQLGGAIEFDDMYFGSPTAGKKRGWGTEKDKVFVALSMNEWGNPCFLKIQITPNTEQASVKEFAHAAFADGSVIHSDGYRSYIPTLEGRSMSIDFTISVLAFFIGCISSSVTSRRLFWAPIMACPTLIVRFAWFATHIL